MAELVGLTASIYALVEGLIKGLKWARKRGKRGSGIVHTLEHIRMAVQVLESSSVVGNQGRGPNPPSVDWAEKTLYEVEASLRSIQNALPQLCEDPTRAMKVHYQLSLLWYGMWHGGKAEQKLKHVQESLSLFRDARLKRVDENLLLVRDEVHGRPPPDLQICDNPVQVGLDRAQEVFQSVTSWLSMVRSNTQPPSRFFVVGLVGQGGIGKDMLLQHTIGKMEQSANGVGFNVMAYVELMSDRPDKIALMEIQSRLIKQLGGSQITGLQSRAVGRKALLERFQALQKDQLSTCIFISNVWQSEDLQSILPERFVAGLPNLNICIMISSRVQNTVEELVLHCGGNLNLGSFYKHEPPLLDDQTARELFLGYAQRQQSGPCTEDMQMVNEIFPLCGGLPLVLKMAGSRFAYEGDALYWKAWVSAMQPGIAGISFPEINHIFKLSYENLSELSRRALLDIEACFLDWKWQVVEHIVGPIQMKSLHNYSLIRRRNTVEEFGRKQSVVSMHTLIRKLAAEERRARDKRARDNGERVKWNPESWSPSLLRSTNDTISWNLTFLCLDVEKVRKEERPPEGEVRPLPKRVQSPLLSALSRPSLEHMKNLKVLVLLGSFDCAQMVFPISLRCMILKRNPRLSDVEIPLGLEHLELNECENLLRLPSSLYECEGLRHLSVIGCPGFQTFSTSSKWIGLTDLWLENCPALRRVSADILERLQWLSLIHCESLEPLCSQITCHVQIHGCPLIKAESSTVNGCPYCKHVESNSVQLMAASSVMPMPAYPLHPTTVPQESSMSLPLLDHRIPTRGAALLPAVEDEAPSVVRLPQKHGGNGRSWPPKGHARSLDELNRLKAEEPNTESLIIEREFSSRQAMDWQTLDGMIFLKKLKLKDCVWPELAEIPNRADNPMKNLTKLRLDSCLHLRSLPQSICSLEALVVLSLRGSWKLQNLPEEIGSLSALEVLDLSSCEQLRRLPHSLCEMKSLRELIMHMCRELVKLPHELGNLRSLRKLRLSFCERLSWLPDSMCRLGSLEELDLAECKGLEELPTDMGNLTSLREINMNSCSSIRVLPGSCANLNLHLFCVLDLEGCTQLQEVPMEVLAVNCLRIEGDRLRELMNAGMQ